MSVAVEEADQGRLMDTRDRAPARRSLQDGNHLHRELHTILNNAGCFDLKISKSVMFGTVLLTLYGFGNIALLAMPDWPLRMLLLLLLAGVSVQGGFLGHEAGHGALTKKRKRGDLVGRVFMTFVAGLTHTHFQFIHRHHHPHCNTPRRDVDMESGIFSMHEASAREKTGFGRFVTRHQGWLIWPLISLQGFSIKIDGVYRLWLQRRRSKADQLAIGLHYCFWIIGPAFVIGPGEALLNYVIMTWFIGPYLGAVFLLNHIGTEVVPDDSETSHFYRQIYSTRNLTSGRLADIFFGGLNNHVEHHLYPDIPTMHLAKARKITRDFCHKRDIPYREMGWWQGAREVRDHLTNLSEVTRRKVRT